MERLIGVVHYALFPAAVSGTGDVTGSFEPILSDGFFGAIEVTWIKDDQVRRKAADILSGAGVQVMFSGGPPLLNSDLSLSSVDSASRSSTWPANWAREMSLSQAGPIPDVSCVRPRSRPSRNPWVSSAPTQWRSVPTTRRSSAWNRSIGRSSGASCWGQLRFHPVWFRRLGSDLPAAASRSTCPT